MPAIRVVVRVRPGASRTRVGGFWGEDCQLVVAVSPPPVDGAANEAVLEAVAKAFEVKRRQVSLVSGHTARSKVLEIEIPDRDLPGMEERLAQLRSAERRVSRAD